MTEINAWDFPNDAIPSGSAGYYVARFSPVDKRNEIARWLAWFTQIDQIAEKANDPGVARLKLDWWREELQLIKNKQARHPIAIALSQHQIADWQLEQMLRALAAIESRILKQQPTDLNAFAQQCADQHGSRLRLLSNNHTQAEQLGQYTASIERLQQLGRDVRKDYLSLPKDLMQANKLSADNLEALNALPALNTLAETLLNQQEDNLRKQLSNMRKNSELQTPLRIAAQSYQLSRLMRRQQYACNQKLFNLSPLRLLWSAWRMR